MSPDDRESQVQQRLAAGVRALDAIDRNRRLGGDVNVGKAAEQRIVLRELLELELQDVDEQLERIRVAREQIE